MASYHTNTAHFSVNRDYFTSSGADNAPLHALATGVSGDNGVFRYGASSASPDQSFNSSNYWVDECSAELISSQSHCTTFVVSLTALKSEIRWKDPFQLLSF